MSEQTRTIKIEADKNDLEVIDIAASIVGLNRSSFIIEAALNTANEMLHNEGLIEYED